MAVINTNYLALVSQNNLNRSQSALGSAIERLSSGLRINSAKDDAAGQAIANRFTANIKGLTQAARNANDGISIAQTTEGALNEINNNLQRIRELTVQAANGTNSASDIDSIQQEVNERLAEIHRVAEQTNFNGINVLEGSSDVTFTIQVGANDNETIDIEISGNAAWNLYDAGATGNAGAVNGDARIVDAKGFDVRSALATNPTSDTATYNLAVAQGTATLAADSFTVDSDRVVSYNNGDSYAVLFEDAGGAVRSFALSFDSEGKAAIGNELTGTAKEAAEASTATVTIGTDSVKVQGGDSNALAKIDAALNAVDNQRSKLGAVQNRFESTISNLNNTVTNMSAARSRIEDADYAVEVSNMTRAQILQQAGTAVLAQANQVPQTMLSLLR